MIRLLIFIIGISLSNTALAKPYKKKCPNIVFILIDDLGWKDTGYMGSDYYETPHIDQLAAIGVNFDQAYAPAANCAPSRACIMSGQNTPRHGIYTVGSSERGKAHTRKLIPTPNTVTLADSIVTLAEALKEAGYVTAQMGKWHLGDDPCTQGFDVNVAGSHAGHPKSYFSPYKNKDLVDGPDGEYLTDRLTNEAIKYISQQAERKDTPFFLYLPYFTVHTPLQGKEELINKYRKKGGEEGQNNPVYAAMVESADQNIGRLMDALKNVGVAQNTLVIFSSDNGGIAKISSQKPLRAGKGSYYEGGIRVPLVISWPGHIPAGKTINTPVASMDVYPSILELCGLKRKPKQPLDGQSLVALMQKDKPLKREALYWHFPIYLQGIHPVKDQARDPLFRTRPGSAMRMGKWKLHEYFEDGALELYNLENDPGEWHNLADSLPGIKKELHDMLVKWRFEMNAPVPDEHNPAYVAEKE
ncbi:sulfatase [Carboxylicivirga sp. RSCT41]|uniref:sulfatase n=1 Tax=Carboxylicivirga agarovorans TaxID=3417570 RepID=UPI003D326A2F